MASRNPESLTNQGEFQPRKPRSEPMTTKGHAPGVKVGNDAAPEFHAEQHPPGTAPRQDTYQPRPAETDDISAQAQSGEPATFPNVEDTLGGATSASVHTGLGKPVQGQEGRELHGNYHTGNRKNKERSGLAGVGASAGEDVVRAKGADLPEGVYRGVKGVEWSSATEKLPEGAETVARERP